MVGQILARSSVGAVDTHPRRGRRSYSAESIDRARLLSPGRRNAILERAGSPRWKSADDWATPRVRISWSGPLPATTPAIGDY